MGQTDKQTADGSQHCLMSPIVGGSIQICVRLTVIPLLVTAYVVPREAH